MDKIKQLLQQNGVSVEAASQICESLETYTSSVKAQYDAEFQKRLTNAKKVCKEEVEAHKAELARRVQIFLEAKCHAIEESIGRDMAKRETEAVAKLEKITALVEGIEIDGKSQTELKGEVDKLQKLAHQLVEERDQATRKARNLQGISERLIKRSRQLERAVSEGSVKVIAGKLDAGRQGGQPCTSRPTIRENIDRQPVGRAAGPDHMVSVMSAPRTPDEIAATIEETL